MSRDARWASWAVAVGLLIASLLHGGAWGEERVLRVCADPENLPFTDRSLQGFENRIADLIAQAMGARVEYTWWVSRYLRRMLRNTLLAGRCDIMLGLPYDERFTEDLPAIALTRPYYTTGYALVYVPDRQTHLDKVRSVDELPEGLRVGVWNRTPPQDVLALRGYAHIVAYHPWYPEEVLRDLQAGQIDAAIVWGPTAGFYNKVHYAGAFAVRLLEGPDFTWRIAAIVRKDDTALLERVNAVLEQNGAQIQKILDDFGIPYVRASSLPSPGSGELRPATASPPASHELGVWGSVGFSHQIHKPLSLYRSGGARYARRVMEDLRRDGLAPGDLGLGPRQRGADQAGPEPQRVAPLRAGLCQYPV